MKKVIVTGANGFVGRHLLKVLLSNNIEVYAIVRKKTVLDDLKEYYESVHWIEGDLYDDPGIMMDELIENGASDADCLYYLAWCGVASDKKNDYNEQIKNITIAKNIITISKNLKCRRIVNLGTVGEYVSLDGLINEKWVPSPADIYGAVKVSVRHLLSVQASREKIDVVNTILCSTYGEYRCDDNVISYTIKQLLNGNCPEYGSMEQMWDFLYIEDAAMALYLIGDKGLAGKTYSIGSGIYRHLYEYIEIIRDQIDPDLPLGIGKLGNKYEKVLNSCVDTFQLQKDTGFVPQYTFVEGIRNTINYFRREL